MRHTNYCWPWRLAYATHFDHISDKIHHHKAEKRKHYYETRWHGRGSSDFGVRRPLRYLSHHLDLDDSQTRRLASVLNQLKTEREQAKLDEKRTVATMANLLVEGTPTLDNVKDALSGRVRSAEQMQEETAKAVVAICDLLDDDQREEFVNLLLTETLSF